MKTHIHCGDTFRINSGPTSQIFMERSKQMWEYEHTDPKCPGRLLDPIRHI